MSFRDLHSFGEVPAFKRMFYNSLIKFIDESEFNFCALLGSRQVGKTIALKQVFFTRQNSSQVLLCNFKEIGFDEQEDFVCSTLDRLEDGNLNLLLLDEITYLDGYEDFLLHLKELIDLKELKTKIILTGSSCTMIARSCRRVIANNIIYVQAPFLTFYEYLVYNGKIKRYTSACFSTDSLHQVCSQSDIKLITKEDFFQYVEHAYRFTNLVSIRDYLQHCVDENIISRTNRSWTSEDAIGVDVEVALSILYCSMYSLHKNPDWVKFKENPKVFANEFLKVKRKTGIKKQEFQKYVIYTLLFEKIQGLTRVPWKVLKNALHFLFDAGLITFQFQNEDVSDSQLLNWFSGRSKELLHGIEVGNIEEFLRFTNILIVSPIPYVAVVLDLCNVLQENEYDVAVRDILKEDQFGSFLEVFLKGSYSLLNANRCINEFRKDVVVNEVIRTAEIDICDHTHHILMKIGNRDKRLRDTWFDYYESIIPYTNILVGDYLCNTEEYSSERYFCCERVPYPQASLWLDCILYKKLQRV